MATVTKTFDFETSDNSFEDIGSSGNIAFTHGGTYWTVASTAASMDDTEQCRNENSPSAETWEDWGVPAGATVVGVRVTSARIRNVDLGNLDAAVLTMQVIDDDGNPLTETVPDCFTLDLLAQGVDGAFVAHDDLQQAVLLTKQVSTTGVRFQLQVYLANGFNAATYETRIGDVVLEIQYYTTASAAAVNQLKTPELQRGVLAWASGRHVVDGHLVQSYTTGTSPTHRIHTRHALGDGVWEGPEGVWVNGLNVPSTDWIFLRGDQAASSDYFTKDQPHWRTPILDVKWPQGVGDADTAATEPTGVTTIIKCERFPDWDNTGLKTDNGSYTVNPARVLAGWLERAGIDIASRIDWSRWADWRDYLGTDESVDYTTILTEGFGLRGTYFSDNSLTTEYGTRIDPVIEFPASAGSPMVGLATDNFSVRWEGYIKPPEDADYTFEVDHIHGAKLWVDNTVRIDQTGTTGTHASSAISLTGGTFYSIKLEWTHTTGNAEIRLKWSSANIPEEVIPTEYLFPSTVDQPRYEAHVAFSEPTTLDAIVSRVLTVSNSIRKDVDGKIQFWCLEELTADFEITAEMMIPGTIRMYRSDIRASEMTNVWEAKFRDLESQYLEEPLQPIAIEVEDLITAAGRRIYGTTIDLGNMTRWQAYKVLQTYVDYQVRNDLFLEFEASAATYWVQAGDLVTVTNADLDSMSSKTFMVIEAEDRSGERTADVRWFKLQEV